MKLFINEEALEIIKRHAVESFPNESVGFFYGTSDKNGKAVYEAKPVLNAKKGDQRRRFEIDPLDYMKAEKYALDQQIELLGIYHSHPLHPAIPSEHDLKQAVPFFSYIITSVQPDEVINVTSWQLNHLGIFKQEKIEIVNENVLTK